MEEHGIKELKEALVGANELTMVLLSQFKDGVQFTDFAALFAKYQTDAELKAKLDAAVSGLGKVPQEVGDLSLTEGLDLAIVQMGYVPKILAALK